MLGHQAVWGREHVSSVGTSAIRIVFPALIIAPDVERKASRTTPLGIEMTEQELKIVQDFFGDHSV